MEADQSKAAYVLTAAQAGKGLSLRGDKSDGKKDQRYVGAKFPRRAIDFNSTLA